MWIDKLDRERWTIIRQNWAGGVVNISADNYFTIPKSGHEFRHIEIRTPFVTLDPTRRLWLDLKAKRELENQPRSQKPTNS